MFGLMPPVAFGLPPSNPDAEKLVRAIRDQTEGVPPHMVYVLDIVSVRFGGYFTPQVRQQLQKYRYLQMLTLNDCGIVSLQNFPNLPALIRLDMVFNSIPGEHLRYINTSRHIQTLMLGANKIQKIQHLQPLKNLRQLLQLDLLNNPIVNLPGYRNTVFGMLPSLSILDTLDKIGKDAYNNSTMLEAVSRVPDNLFDKSLPPPPAPLVVHVDVHKKQQKKLKSALARKTSLDSDPLKVSKPSGPRVNPKGKINSKLAVVGGKTRSSRAGLTFPVGRIKRKLKQVMIGQRVSVGGSIYTAAVLQYLAAQMLQLAGLNAINDHKKRITPVNIKNAIKNDEQLKKMLQNVTVGNM